MKTEQEIKSLRDNLSKAFNDRGKNKVQFVWTTEIDALSWVLGEKDDWSHIDLINDYLKK